MKEMRDVILGLRNQGKTIFFNSHILAEVERICDRVGIMHGGKMLRVANELHSHLVRERNDRNAAAHQARLIASWV